MHWLLSVSPVYRWAITLAFVGIVVALSIAPDTGRPGDTFFSWLVVNTATPIQKAMHVTAYATLAVLLMWSLESVESRAMRIALVLVASLCLGAILEWYQTQVPGRFGTVVDVLINAIGTIAGLLAAVLFL